MDYFTHELYPRDCGNECSAKVEKMGRILATKALNITLDKLWGPGQ